MLTNKPLFDEIESDKVHRTFEEYEYNLQELTEHKDWEIRRAVARQGYGLDKLMHDGNEEVREAVEGYLFDNDYETVINWARDKGDLVFNKSKLSSFIKFEEVKRFLYEIMWESIDSCKLLEVQNMLYNDKREIVDGGTYNIAKLSDGIPFIKITYNGEGKFSFNADVKLKYDVFSYNGAFDNVKDMKMSFTRVISQLDVYDEFNDFNEELHFVCSEVFK